MSKSLVVKRHDGYFTRAATPADGVHVRTEDLPHYSPAAAARTWPDNKPTVVKAHVTVGSHGFEPKGGKVDEIRHVPDPAKRDLAVIDAEKHKLKERLEELVRLEQHVLCKAFEAGTPVTVAEMKEWREQRRPKTVYALPLPPRP